MANHTLDNVTIIQRNDTTAKWTAKNPVLAMGEVGWELDTGKAKIGDGVKNWAALKYINGGEVVNATSSPSTSATDYEVGTLWIDTTANKIYCLFAKTSSSATWKRLPTAEELARKVSLTGDATGDGSFDGDGNATITVVLPNSGVSEGTYTKLTVNAKGLITSATQLIATDIPMLTLAKISDAGTAAAKNVGTAAGNVVGVGADGKIDENLLPKIAITEPFPVASEFEMLALSAEKGDIAIRADTNKSYILKQTPASTLSNWLELKTPDCNVLSVNGKTGSILLTTGDIAEGSNKYFTDARATANFNSNYSLKSVHDLTDGQSVILTSDTITISGGKA